jgi:hypothetical protein
MRWAFVFTLIACVEPKRELCDDGSVCPAGTTCAPLAGDSGYACIGGDPQCGNGRLDEFQLLDGFAVPFEQCDIADGLAHDGCSGTCLDELAEWRTLPVTEFPTGGEMIHDVHRNRLVLVGNGSTLEWDGIAWRLATPLISPQPRTDFAMAYDAKRRRTVLFGGRFGGGLDDTWEWDGLSWQLMSPTEAPAPRGFAMMAYDPDRERVILFGGKQGRLSDSFEALADLWEWDGTTWTELTVTGPSARAAAAMTYDPRRGVIVMFGGMDAGQQFLADTWELSASGWTERVTATKPAQRARAAMTFDVTSGRVVLQGGGTSTGDELGDTWAWDGATWIQLEPDQTSRGPEQPIASFAREGYIARIDSTGTMQSWNGTAWSAIGGSRPPVLPLSRSHHAAAIDFEGRRLLMFGGCTGPSNDQSRILFDDTWVWDGGSWVDRSSVRPPARVDAAMAYDAARREFVLFGGQNDAFEGLSDTWVHDGAGWTERLPATVPVGRFGHTMVYDARRQRVVMYGGRDGNAFDERTWEWDGTDWTPRDLDPRPGPLHGAAAAYDPIAEVVVVFGGMRGSSFVDETWIYDGETWSLRTVTNKPLPRISAGLAWSAPQRALVLYGGEVAGSNSVAETWEWTGTDWSFVPIAGPAARVEHVLVPSLDGTGVLLFGGRARGSDPTTFGELVQLSSRSATLDETCARSDLDGDGLARCDDPDCWVFCRPTCPPGAPCLGSPTCGDNTCTQPGESCETCPADCGECPVRCGDGVADPSEAANCPGDR